MIEIAEVRENKKFQQNGLVICSKSSKEINFDSKNSTGFSINSNSCRCFSILKNEEESKVTYENLCFSINKVKNLQYDLSKAPRKK